MMTINNSNARFNYDATKTKIKNSCFKKHWNYDVLGF